jgi:hypothetical protein
MQDPRHEFVCEGQPREETLKEMENKRKRGEGKKEGRRREQ